MNRRKKVSVELNVNFHPLYNYSVLERELKMIQKHQEEKLGDLEREVETFEQKENGISWNMS